MLAFIKVTHWILFFLYLVDPAIILKKLKQVSDYEQLLVTVWQSAV